MKGIVRIGGALILGTALIAGAWYVSTHKAANETSSVAIEKPVLAIAVAPERHAIEPIDADKNGIPDWKEQLVASIDIENLALSTSSDYFPPETMTDHFARSLMEGFLYSESGAYPQTPEQIANSSLALVQTSYIEGRQFTRADILAILPTGKDSVFTYGNELMSVAAQFTGAFENPIDILISAFDTQDFTKLEHIHPIIEMYQNTIGGYLAMAVPEELIPQHLELINAYQGLAAATGAISTTPADPLAAVVGLQLYNESAARMVAAYRAILPILDSYDITYQNEDPGVVFYLLE